MSTGFSGKQSPFTHMEEWTTGSDYGNRLHHLMAEAFKNPASFGESTIAAIVDKRLANNAQIEQYVKLKADINEYLDKLENSKNGK